MGGITPMQHRVANGCFVSQLCSSRWSPGSSGKAKFNGRFKGGSNCSSPPPTQKLFGVLFLFLKLAVFALPAVMLTNSPNYVTNPYLGYEEELLPSLLHKQQVRELFRKTIHLQVKITEPALGKG